MNNHQQRLLQRAEPRLSPALIISMADLLAVTVCIEQFFIKLIELAEVEYVQLGNLANSTGNYLSAHEQQLREAAPPGRQLTRALDKTASWSRKTLLELTDPAKALRRLCADCDRSFACSRTTGRYSRFPLANKASALSAREIM